MKQLVRAIVLSSTYRQDSRASERCSNVIRATSCSLAVRGSAPRPKWFATSHSRRRACSRKKWAAAVYPPVPESLFALNFVKIDWKPAPRRSGIGARAMFRRRSMPDPVMGSFDAPSGDSSCVRRVRSNTPLAALASLNEPVFVEAAQALALRTLREGKSDEDRAACAFRSCTGRAPKPAEVTTILELLRSRDARIAEAGYRRAREVSVGDSKLPAAGGNESATAGRLDDREPRAAELDETLTKN